jgi:hypothetical protein
VRKASVNWISLPRTGGVSRNTSKTARLFPHVHVRAQHSVAQAAGLSLPHIVDLGEFGGVHHGVQPVSVVLDGERRLQLRGVFEVVLENGLVAARDWIAGRSTTCSSSFGIAFVAGRNRVLRPAAGTTACEMRFVGMRRLYPHGPTGRHRIMRRGV